jgi:oligopeptide/dipeptide ABC transporter ATP-binding protein
MTEPLLQLRRVTTRLVTRRGGLAPVLVDVSLSIARGEFVGLVGESGSGKTMTARTILRALPPRATVTGEVLFAGEDVMTLSSRRLRELRAKRLGVIFQDPRSHVDPVWTIGDHVTEGMRVIEGMSQRAARARAAALLRMVGIPDGEQRLRQYPGELSGGMLQRVMIAGALAGEPDLLIADEPTTALDVTTQAEIVAILNALRRERSLTMLFVTHDLALAAQLCDRIVVMYAGRIVESQPAASLLSVPRHPYTRALVAARPALDVRKGRLEVLPGLPTSALDAPAGCPFHPRCRFAIPRCTLAEPALVPVGDSALSACIRSVELEEQLRVG